MVHIFLLNLPGEPQVLCIGLKMLMKSGRKKIAGEMKEAEKRIPFFVAVNAVSVWRTGFPVLRLFVVYIARAPSNYCADATPTRGVWSQIHSLRHNLSRLYRLPDSSPCNVYTFMKHTWGHVSRLYSPSSFHRIYTHQTVAYIPT